MGNDAVIGKQVVEDGAKDRSLWSANVGDEVG